MSRQDKATTERNAKILRELVRQPDNKVCADCKHPRWASWNLGVFLCIRCSGIHRGMGTHISRVKSVDLDMWTPDQMDSIQKWGNRRANLYWEAHLKAGHVPPDHKMESFVRSKYESRRWALDGPPPADPSTLEHQSGEPEPTEQAQIALSPGSNQSHTVSSSISAQRGTSSSQAYFATNHPQSRQLLSTAVAEKNRTNQTSLLSINPPTVSEPPQPAPPQDDLFSLDFHNPSTAKPASPPPTKDVKQDILSLFSSPTASAPSTTQSAGPATFGQFASVSQHNSPWDQFGTTQQQTQAQNTGLIGSNGTGMWGTTSGWNAAPAPSIQGNIWGTSAAVQPTAQVQPVNALHSNDLWGSSSSQSQQSGDLFGTTPAIPSQKKDDVFGDIWGDFK
ncbi:hypothetical protein BJ138DRAFT_1066042 [Hygrophoropsis aurantiaca]|uniref:Uncharacterized protein n=1 Tax=Hygrophoropsis aurantiaca TaxID=72124 RepID=A0ACB8ABG3_9AGAM|nr:hypothetical protein BJ138DRAFT_1066042 [Hygrophoropsis aurantiaca]